MIDGIVGIDYSLTSPSVCVIHSGLIRMCAFHTKKEYKEVQHENFRICLYPQISYTSEQERHDKLSGWALGIIVNYAGEQPRVNIEGYSFGSSSGRAFDIAENGGLLKHKLWTQDIKFNIIPPTTLKKFVTGKGNAKKEQMIEEFTRRHFDISVVLSLKNANSKPIDDLVDAFFLANYAGLGGV